MHNKIWNKEDIELNYGFGDCAVFSVALSTIFDLPIVEFYSKNNMFHVALVKEGSNIEEDLFLDVFGLSSLDEIKRRYGINGKIKIEVKSENELHQMSEFTQDAIKLAKQHLDFLLMDEKWMNEIQMIQKKLLLDNRECDFKKYMKHV